MITAATPVTRPATLDHHQPAEFAPKTTWPRMLTPSHHTMTNRKAMELRVGIGLVQAARETDLQTYATVPGHH
jgi:hypothetical protein